MDTAQVTHHSCDHSGENAFNRGKLLPAENERVGSGTYWNSREIPYQWEGDRIAYERHSGAEYLDDDRKAPETDQFRRTSQPSGAGLYQRPSATPRHHDDFDFVAFSVPLPDGKPAPGLAVRIVEDKPDSTATALKTVRLRTTRLI